MPKTLSVMQLLLLSVVCVGSVVAIAASLLSRPPQHKPVRAAASAATSGALPSTASPSVAAAPTRKPAVTSDPAESEIIERMQMALRTGDAPQALLVAKEHARRFPSGALAEERESVRAVAHCWLAQPEARPAVLTSFLTRYTGSPYGARVQAACNR